MNDRALWNRSSRSLARAVRSTSSSAGVISAQKVPARGGGLVQVLVGDGDRVVAGERWPSGQQFVEQAARGVQIAAGVGDLGAYLFGGEVVGGSDERAGPRGRGAVVPADTRDAEVDDLDPAAAGDQDVGGLDVTMNDACVVAELERMQETQLVADRFLHCDGPLAEASVQRLAGDVLHDDEGRTRRVRGAFDVVPPDVVNGDDSGVVETGDRLCFSPEPGSGHRVTDQVRVQNLDRNPALEVPVATQVHGPHASLAQDVPEFIASAEHAIRAHEASSPSDG